MEIASLAPFLPEPFGESAAGGTITFPIPTPSQSGITPGRASLNDGFTALNFQPTGSGGIPPFGQDMNGILYWLSWIAWCIQAGAPWQYNATFQTDIGGYPNGALVPSAATAGLIWQSTVDDNVTNPDAGGAGWVVQYATTIQEQVGNFAIDTGSVNTVAITLTPTPTLHGSFPAHLVDGLTIRVRKNNSANTGPVYMTIGSFGPYQITYANGSPLLRGTLPAGGIFEVSFSVPTLTFQLIGGDMSGTNNIPINQTAGTSIAAGNPVLIGPSGLVYPATTTDMAIVDAAGVAYSSSPFAAGSFFTVGPNRLSRIVGPDGNIYIPAPQTVISGVGGVTIFAFNSKLIATGDVINFDNGDTCKNILMQQLSNGNVILCWFNGTNVRFAIVGLPTALSPGFTIVTAATTIETGYASGNPYSDLVVFPSGGFAVCYQQGTSNTLQRLAIYSNTGTVIAGPLTVQTWSGAAGACGCRLRMLSNGNIAIALISGFTGGGTTGSWFAIFNTAGGSVVAATQVLSSATAGTWIELNELAGYFAIATIVSGGSLSVYIYNNAGTAQGSPFTHGAVLGTSGVYGQPIFKLVNDGTNFWALHQDSSNYYLTSAPVAGSGYNTTVLTLGIPNPGSAATFDAVVDLNYYLVISSCEASGAGSAIDTYRLNDIVLIDSVNINAAPFNSLAAIGDFGVLSAPYFSGTAYEAQLVKYAPAVILGSASDAATTGMQTQVYIGQGDYAATALKGSPVLTFDHSAATVPGKGNKGTIFAGGGLALAGY